MKHFIGLDAHSATCTFVVINESGEVTHRTIVKTSEGTLLGFLSSLPGEKNLAVEESHVSQWVSSDQKFSIRVAPNFTHQKREEGAVS